MASRISRREYILTPGGCESHDYYVTKDGECYDPRHHAGSNLISEYFLKENIGHIRLRVHDLDLGYCAQL